MSDVGFSPGVGVVFRPQSPSTRWPREVLSIASRYSSPQSNRSGFQVRIVISPLLGTSRHLPFLSPPTHSRGASRSASFGKGEFADIRQQQLDCIIDGPRREG